MKRNPFHSCVFSVSNSHYVVHGSVRMFAEMGGYWEGTPFEKDVRNLVASTGGPVTFYDSVSGKPLFRAPVGRSVDDFIAESKVQ